MSLSPLFPDYLDEDALLPAAVELAVEDLFPRPEIELPVGDRDNDFTAHHLAFDMSIGIVLAGVVVPVLADWIVRDQTFEKVVVVFKQTGFIVIDIHARADMHRIHKTKAFLDAVFLQGRFYLRSDVDVRAAGFRLKCQFFSIGFHDA